MRATIRVLLLLGVLAVCGSPAGAQFSVGIITPADEAVFEVNEQISFEATCSQCQMEVTYHWEFENGGSGSGWSSQYQYGSAGSKTVKVTATCEEQPPKVATDTVHVRIVGGDPSWRKDEPHYHGTAPPDSDHWGEYGAAEGQPDGTTYQWSTEGHLSVKSTAGPHGEYAYVTGTSASTAVGDSKVRARYALGGKTTGWYTLAEWAREVRCVFVRRDADADGPDGGWRTVYHFLVRYQLPVQGSPYCWMTESFSDWEPDWKPPEYPDVTNWQLGWPNAFEHHDVFQDTYGVPDGPDVYPHPVRPSDYSDDAHIPVDHFTQEYWGGTSRAGSAEGVLMKSHTLRRHLGYGRQDPES